MALVQRIKDTLITSTDLQVFLTAAADMGSERLRDYKRADDYYDGKHRVRLSDRERLYLQASGLPYAENFCETIVDTLASRLIVTGFGSETEEQATFARDVWDGSKMDSGQMKVHEGAVKLGDYFVIVEPGEEPGDLPRLCPNPPQTVKAVYDSGEMVYAVKVWNTNRHSKANPQGRTIRRMNIYWPDAIEKWYTAASDDKGWARYLEADDVSNSSPWTMDGTPDGEPIGIPVLHFAHKPNPHQGVSKLKNVIPQQDALNKSLIDHFWVMDAQGWPQQWATGVSVDDIRRHPGSLLSTEKEGAKFGQLDPADPSKSIGSAESQISRMASRSSTPLHLMLAGGNLPSGETLKTSESGLSRAARRLQLGWNHEWAGGQAVAARIHTAFGEGNFPDDFRVVTRWDRAESRQEVDEANTAVLWKTLGVSGDTILSRLGFDPVEEKMKRERDGEPDPAQELLVKAKAMQNDGPPAGITPAPTRSEDKGGGQQPAQKPANRVV